MDRVWVDISFMRRKICWIWGAVSGGLLAGGVGGDPPSVAPLISSRGRLSFTAAGGTSSAGSSGMTMASFTFSCRIRALRPLLEKNGWAFIFGLIFRKALRLAWRSFEEDVAAAAVSSCGGQTEDDIIKFDSSLWLNNSLGLEFFTAVGFVDLQTRPKARGPEPKFMECYVQRQLNQRERLDPAQRVGSRPKVSQVHGQYRREREGGS